jgi:glycine/D-amino acid oxidase-like deaminating enzyme
MTRASDLAPSYDLAVIGGGPAGLAAASLAARAGLSPVLLDENPGVGGQIYRGFTSTPVTDRTPRGLLGGAELAAEAKASGALIVTGATVWSLDPQRSSASRSAARHDRGQARHHRHRLTGRRFRFPVGLTRRHDGRRRANSTQGARPAADGRTVLAGTGPLLWLLAAQILRAGGKIGRFSHDAAPVAEALFTCRTSRCRRISPRA